MHHACLKAVNTAKGLGGYVHLYYGCICIHSLESLKIEYVHQHTTLATKVQIQGGGPLPVWQETLHTLHPGQHSQASSHFTSAWYVYLRFLTLPPCNSHLLTDSKLQHKLLRIFCGKNSVEHSAGTIRRFCEYPAMCPHIICDGFVEGSWTSASCLTEICRKFTQ